MSSSTTSSACANCRTNRSNGVALSKPAVPCPYCGSSNTIEKSEFGSTACKSIHFCNGCHQPFDYFKAFAESSHWQRGLFVITYDEWGGFFDHVPPPRVQDDTVLTTPGFRPDLTLLGFWSIDTADYERLVMEVWTNGTVSPEEAVSSIKHVRDQLTDAAAVGDLAASTPNCGQ